MNYEQEIDLTYPNIDSLTMIMYGFQPAPLEHKILFQTNLTQSNFIAQIEDTTHI